MSVSLLQVCLVSCSFFCRIVTEKFRNLLEPFTSYYSSHCLSTESDTRDDLSVPIMLASALSMHTDYVLCILFSLPCINHGGGGCWKHFKHTCRNVPSPPPWIPTRVYTLLRTVSQERFLPCESCETCPFFQNTNRLIKSWRVSRCRLHCCTVTHACECEAQTHANCCSWSNTKSTVWIVVNL